MQDLTPFSRWEQTSFGQLQYFRLKDMHRGFFFKCLVEGYAQGFFLKMSSRRICIQIFQKFPSRDGYASMENFHSLQVMHFPVITFSITFRYVYRLCMYQSSHASCANKNIQTFKIETSIFNQFIGELNLVFKKTLPTAVQAAYKTNIHIKTTSLHCSQCTRTA